MSQYFEVHPENPQARLLKQAVQILHSGGIAAMPPPCRICTACFSSRACGFSGWTSKYCDMRRLSRWRCDGADCKLTLAQAPNQPSSYEGRWMRSCSASHTGVSVAGNAGSLPRSVWLSFGL